MILLTIKQLSATNSYESLPRNATGVKCESSMIASSRGLLPPGGRDFVSIASSRTELPPGGRE